MEIHGLLFDIQRFAIHDGPGIRTTLFLKGCPLACAWCHNPESITSRSELAIFGDQCIGCGRCFEVCRHGAHERRPDGGRVFHREACVACGACADDCCSGALVLDGRSFSVEEAMAELRRDLPFYRTSGGGVTLSGGEPMHQAEFSAAILERCRAEGMHTALDTAGYAPWGDFEKVLPFTDLVLFDVKHADAAAHRRLTGVSNETILENLAAIDARATPIEIRIPVIPSLNDDRPNVEATASLLKGLRHLTGVTLLPYHRLGESKYRRVGRSYRLDGLEPPTREHLEAIAGWIRAQGLEVLVR